MLQTEFHLSLREHGPTPSGWMVDTMNLPGCHREERSDVAIQLEFWIAAVGFASFAMTNRECSLEGAQRRAIHLAGLPRPRSSGSQ
jgi:hypothetical protein